MNFLDLYYQIKPLIPRRLQLALRRRMVLRKLPHVRHIWPIDPAAGKAPANWPGWPDNKQFALVLTHDVETAEGLSKVLPLARLEQSLGFRSCFNFVGRDYPVPDQLRHTLTDMGFEVGLHGLTHKGNLFRSRKVFEQQRPEINQVLKEWNAVGFRAPAMYHHLGWTGELDIEYDMSTFDTDPFEPQPESVGTIFPIWVNGGPNGKGFVELPYTMPQDHILFNLLRKQDVRIWKEKLDWIAQQGGMALLLVHPDYLTFDSQNNLPNRYPAVLYQEFLRHAKEKYESLYWPALPKEIAEFLKNQLITNSPNQLVNQSSIHPITQSTIHPVTQSTRKPLRVAMLSYSFYENDARVSRYAETLVRRGDQVDVIAIGRDDSEKQTVIKGVRVYRVQSRERNERGKMTYLARIMKFLVKSSTLLNKIHREHPYDLVHVHSVPDFEVFAAWLPKLKGAKIILDIHDIVPELYAAKFGTGEGSLFYKLLVLLEKTSISFSDQVIISNHLWAETLRRSVGNGKCSVIINYPDEHVFYERPRRQDDGKFIMMYPGTLNWHQGLDIAIRSMARIREKAPQAMLQIYGQGESRDSLEKLGRELGVSDHVIFFDPRPKEEIAAAMAEADLGLVPKRNDSFGGEAFSTKTLEFMSLGVPLLLSKTKIDQYYFNDSVVKFFDPGNEQDLADKMLELINNKKERDLLSEKASKFVEQYKWKNNQDKYLNLVDKLVGVKF
jgi:glycosyltransferase involved in cell wall biosynthesis